MAWLSSLFSSLFKGWLSWKSSTAEQLGIKEAEKAQEAHEIAVLEAQAKAAANAPTAMSQLIEEQREGKV